MIPGEIVKYDFSEMLTTGLMAKKLGVDRRTLLSWVKVGIVPCYLNPANNWHYFVESEVYRSLGLLRKTLSETIDVNL